MERLSRDYRVYAVDIIGEPGKSEESRPEMLPQNYSNWLLEILEQLNIRKANFIGNSLGGWMSLCFATNSPDRVGKLILIAASGVAKEKKSFLLKVIFLSLLGKWGVKKINNIVYFGIELPDTVFEFGNLVFNNYNPRIGGLYIFSDEELKRITMPTLFIAGEKDALLPSNRTADRLCKLLQRLQLKIIKDRGHVVVDCLEDIIGFMKNA